MKTTVTQGGTLAQVRKHQSVGWRLGSGYDVDYREFKLVADDLRTLSGRTGYVQAHEANRLCRELLPLAARRLDILTMHIGFWQKTICEKCDECVLEELQEQMAERHTEGCPTESDTKAAAKALRACSNNYGEEMLLSEIFEDRTFSRRSLPE